MFTNSCTPATTSAAILTVSPLAPENQAPVITANPVSAAACAGTGEDGSRYRAVFTNVAGALASAPAVLTVNLGVMITLPPAEVRAAAGALLSFMAAATGRPAPAVQWQVSSDGGATFRDIAGAIPRC